MKRRGDELTVTGGLVLGNDGAGALTLLPPHSVLLGTVLDCQMAKLLDQVALASTLVLAPGTSTWSEWQRFRRLVSLSGLGWAFVLAAVGWELFAYAFSCCAGWAWDTGAFFFAWGLGMLVFGFFLRTSRKRPAVSRLFLGVNILMVSVLSLVVATR